MRFDSVRAVRADGFTGFVSTATLRDSLSRIPAKPGVYLILGNHRQRPRVLAQSRVGRWKGKDPSLPGAELRAAWVQDSPVLYIGKASTSLKRRLGTYLRHGAGHAAGHWGGRAIWQLAGSDQLLVAWRLERDARAVERALITSFEKTYGKRPFANRTG